MKATELMIGDWVSINDVDCPNPMQIDGIEKKHGSYYAHFRGQVSVDVDQLHSIPITESVLMDNGFTYDYDEEICVADGMFISVKGYTLKGQVCDGDCFLIDYCNGGVRVTTEDSEVKKRMNYVHELQHALRLCGVDKEIEL